VPARHPVKKTLRPHPGNGGRRLINLIGKQFGLLRVIAFAFMVDQQAAWIVKCECGTEKVVRGDSLRRGRSKTCGQQTCKQARNHAIPRT
jgi:hypothetical protein